MDSLITKNTKGKLGCKRISTHGNYGSAPMMYLVINGSVFIMPLVINLSVAMVYLAIKGSYKMYTWLSMDLTKSYICLLMDLIKSIKLFREGSVNRLRYVLVRFPLQRVMNALLSDGSYKPDKFCITISATPSISRALTSSRTIPSPSSVIAGHKFPPNKSMADFQIKPNILNSTEQHTSTSGELHKTSDHFPLRVEETNK
ncbi:hypothetical protein CEXT_71751 [Caerostris extrusa]|uniref:Uncharacterized protein n=1 Tax=Caerostris extrusa TaxID=172846 RepID=A0AAV4N9U3_CAEEX|nr:hypothetical protein CEXT_71751 [Caerostris extrusa]